MKNKIIVIIGILSYGILLADEIKQIEPFGIKLNHPLTKSSVTSDIAGSNMKVLSNPPKPVSIFTTYGVSINKSKLVTTVVGLGKIHKNDAYCFGSQAEFTKVENILTKKYNTPSKSTNYLFYDSIWKESRDYKMSIIKNERSHYATWDNIPTNQNIEISLEESATREGCFIKLVYKDKSLNIEQNKKQDAADAESF